MIGVMYITQGRMPFVVEDASNWAFSNTGLRNGDTLTNPDGSFSSAMRLTPWDRTRRQSRALRAFARDAEEREFLGYDDVPRRVGGDGLRFGQYLLRLRRPADAAGPEERPVASD